MNEHNATEPRPSRMSAREFVARFGHVYEQSPWVAEETARRGLDESADSLDGLAALMSAAVDAAPEARKLELLRAHPDLAGRLALAGEMTADSAGEQSAAGLDQCSAEELARFQDYNRQYTARFGFPFIIAVRGLDRRRILERFAQRLRNTREAEFDEALAQVNRIARLRLGQLFAGRGS